MPQRLSQPRLVCLGFSYVILGVSMVVLWGWVAHDPRLIQISPGWAPMQFNSALSFLFLSIASILNSNGRLPKLAAGLSVLTATFAALTFSQYVHGINLGIDELWIQGYILTGTSHPGRMAANTAACFFFSGSAIAILALSPVRKFWYVLSYFTGALSLSLGVTGLLGYFFDYSPVYGWGNFTRMAIHTAVSFIFLSISLLVNSSRRLKENSIGLNQSIPAFAGAAFLALAITLWQGLVQYEMDQMNKAIQIQANSTARSIEFYLKDYVLSLERVARRQEDKGDPTKKGLENAKSLFLQSIPSGYQFLLEKNGTPIFQSSQAVSDLSRFWSARAPVRYKNINWTLVLYPTEKTLASNTSSIPTLVLILALLVASLLTLLFQKIIQLKENKLSIEESRNFMSTVLDHLPVALFCKDYQNNFRFSLWNRKASEIWGLHSEQVLGKTDFDFFPPEQAQFFRNKDQETMANGKIIEIPEEPVQTTHAGNMIARTKKVPVYDSKGNPKYLLGISEDITEAKRTEALLKEQRAKIIHSEKMACLGEMAGGIAHEINNPLAIIKTNAEQLLWLAEQGKLDLDRIKKISTAVSITVDRTAKIILGLKSLARDGEQDNFAPARIQDIISDTVELCLARFKYHQIDIRIGEIPTDLSSECRSVQISQVLLNLLSNSFDAIQNQPAAFIEISTQDLGDRIEIAVTDSGNGIPREIAKRIMQPFFTTKEVGKGTGLGLSLSQSIVRAHHGDLYLDQSSPHTRFVIMLPKKQPQAGSNVA